jgi:hypothetical protein
MMTMIQTIIIIMTMMLAISVIIIVVVVVTAKMMLSCGKCARARARHLDQRVHGRSCCSRTLVMLGNIVGLACITGVLACARTSRARECRGRGGGDRW